MLQRGEGTLFTIEAVAHAARGTDRYDCIAVAQVSTYGIDEILGVVEGAPERDRILRSRRVKPATLLAHGPRNLEIDLSVRHLRQLRADDARRMKRLEHVPAWTRTAEA